jgi:hypothetical protein
MSSLYYFAAWTDSGCFLGCDHQHMSVLSALACIATAGGYVVAVQDGQLRELNPKEETEFQFAMYGTGVQKGRLRVVTPFKVLKPILN